MPGRPGRLQDEVTTREAHNLLCITTRGRVTRREGLVPQFAFLCVDATSWKGLWIYSEPSRGMGWTKRLSAVLDLGFLTFRQEAGSPRAEFSPRLTEG